MAHRKSDRYQSMSLDDEYSRHSSACGADKARHMSLNDKSTHRPETSTDIGSNARQALRSRLSDWPASRAETAIKDEPDKGKRAMGAHPWLNKAFESRQKHKKLRTHMTQ